MQSIEKQTTYLHCCLLVVLMNEVLIAQLHGTVRVGLEITI